MYVIYEPRAKANIKYVRHHDVAMTHIEGITHMILEHHGDDIGEVLDFNFDTLSGLHFSYLMLCVYTISNGRKIKASSIINKSNIITRRIRVINFVGAKSPQAYRRMERRQQALKKTIRAMAGVGKGALHTVPWGNHRNPGEPLQEREIYEVFSNTILQLVTLEWLNANNDTADTTTVMPSRELQVAVEIANKKCLGHRGRAEDAPVKIPLTAPDFSCVDQVKRLPPLKTISTSNAPDVVSLVGEDDHHS